MACEERMAASGYFERDLLGDPVDMTLIDNFYTDFVNAKRDWVKTKLDGICEAGCELKISETIKPDFHYVTDPQTKLEKLIRFTVRYGFSAKCVDPAEEEEGD